MSDSPAAQEVDGDVAAATGAGTAQAGSASSPDRTPRQIPAIEEAAEYRSITRKLGFVTVVSLLVTGVLTAAV